MASDDQARVLSIQSHVVCGHVGNTSATFPLQVLGLEVNTINSVQLSNHTGYEHTLGQVLNSSELQVLFKGLKLNDIHHYSHLLTGYCGSDSFLKEIAVIAKELKAKNPQLVFVCDPVLGDNGKFYVPETFVKIYREEIIPLADVITPNQFEAELLSEMKINNEKDALQAMAKLHDMGIKTVVITSSETSDENTLVLLASRKIGSDSERFRLRMPKFDSSFTGTGDIFSSMFLAWMSRHPDSLKTACEKTVSATHLVLKRTQAAIKEQTKEGKPPTPFQRELRLIQSIDDIRDPQVLFTAEPISD